MRVGRKAMVVVWQGVPVLGTGGLSVQFDEDNAIPADTPSSACDERMGACVGKACDGCSEGLSEQDSEYLRRAFSSKPACVHDEPSFAFRSAKRCFDVVSSACGLVLLSPLLLGTAVAVKATSPGPVIFAQLRFGKDKKPFLCYKFRSMLIDTPADIPTAVMLENPKYMTPIGAFLRKTSIDELPQLLNVLKGEMSIVGPRPMILAEYEQIIERDRTGANDIRPGITGWAQVNGRDAVGMREKADCDGEYRAKMTAGFDFAVIARTFGVVAKKSGYVMAATSSEDDNSKGMTPSCDDGTAWNNDCQ